MIRTRASRYTLGCCRYSRIWITITYYIQPTSKYVCIVTTFSESVCVCVCVVIPFILDVRLVDVPAGVLQKEGRTGFLHLPSAVLALIFLARRIEPFLSFVDREVEFGVRTKEKSQFVRPNFRRFRGYQLNHVKLSHIVRPAHRHTPSGQSRVYRVTQGVQARSPQGSSSNGCCLGLINVRLSFPHPQSV